MTPSGRFNDEKYLEQQSGLAVDFSDLHTELMAVAVKSENTFEFGAATPLFDTGMQHHWAAARNHYDVSRDGQQLLFMSPVDDDRATPFTVVVNWAAQLHRQDR